MLSNQLCILTYIFFSHTSIFLYHRPVSLCLFCAIQPSRFCQSYVQSHMYVFSLAGKHYRHHFTLSICTYSTIAFLPSYKQVKTHAACLHVHVLICACCVCVFAGKELVPYIVRASCEEIRRGEGKGKGRAQPKEGGEGGGPIASLTLCSGNSK